jgi:hypothetical protein
VLKADDRKWHEGVISSNFNKNNISYTSCIAKTAYCDADKQLARR